MSVMSFEGDLMTRESDCWYHLLKESAKRGVLFRRTGCNFISVVHTDADVDRAIEAARAALQGLKLS
jgi:glutamate-1-semialdehyde aminotransferase